MHGGNGSSSTVMNGGKGSCDKGLDGQFGDPPAASGGGAARVASASTPAAVTR